MRDIVNLRQSCCLEGVHMVLGLQYHRLGHDYSRVRTTQTAPRGVILFVGLGHIVPRFVTMVCVCCTT